VRIHVVGSELFAERIISESVDYRFHRGRISNAYCHSDVSHEIRHSCLKYCSARGLLFAGFDFKLDQKNGEWYVLEVNPRPGYESYDRRQGGRISRALLFLLKEGTKGTEEKVSRPASRPIEPFIEQGRRPPIRILP